jgi:hypothetical protein
MSKEFQVYLDESGISQETSIPHTHQQNGRAERIQRTIHEKAEAIRKHAGMKDGFWKASMETAIHIYNRTPSKIQNWKTPYESWFGKLPNVSRLRIFGCQAWMTIPKEARLNKLSDKARKTVFIGYPEGSKGWKLYNPSNGKIWDSFDVRFDEHIFPMKSSNKVQYMLPEYNNEGDISASEIASEEILYPRNEGEYINIGNIRNPITDEDEEDLTYVEALKDIERREKEKNKETVPSGGSISDAFRGRLSPLDEYSEEFPGVLEPPAEESSQSPPADVRRSRRESRPNPRY